MRVRSARLIEHGQPLRVEEVDLPAPGPGEVVVDMAYGGVNPVDRYRAEGRVAPDAPLPRTLGGEGSGTVDGRAVMVRADGLWATSVVVPESALIDVPDGVDLRVAAAMGVAGVTAWRCVVDVAAVTPDDRVLVLAASGGVGSVALSVARGIGATVWGQTGSPDKVAWIRERGASEVVVADADGLAGAVGDLRPTVVIDPLGGGFTGAAVTALQARGRLVLLGTSAGLTGLVPLQELYRKGLVVSGYAGLIEPAEALDAAANRALDAAAAGKFEIVIDRALPLDRINDGFRLLTDRGVRGKLLVDLAG